MGSWQVDRLLKKHPHDGWTGKTIAEKRAHAHQEINTIGPQFISAVKRFASNAGHATLLLTSLKRVVDLLIRSESDAERSESGNKGSGLTTISDPDVEELLNFLLDLTDLETAASIVAAKVRHFIDVEPDYCSRTGTQVIKPRHQPRERIRGLEQQAEEQMEKYELMMPPDHPHMIKKYGPPKRA